MPISAAADLQNAFEKWTDALRYERHASDHTLRAYISDLSVFFAFITEHKGKPPSLNDLGDMKLADFRSWLSNRTVNGQSAASRARELSSLRSFMKWLDNEGILHNPHIKHIRTPKQPRKLPRPLSRTDTKTVLKHASHPGAEDNWIVKRDTALFTLLYGCGLRINEALSLNHEDRPQNGEVRVKGKGNRERMVPVLPVVEAAITDYLSDCPFDTNNTTPLPAGNRNAPCIATQFCLPSFVRWQQSAPYSGTTGPCFP